MTSLKAMMLRSMVTIVVLLCVASASGATVASWGYNFYGQLGNGFTSTSYSPLILSSFGSNASFVGRGGFHSFAIQNGGLYAWGQNTYGELGTGTNASSTRPVAVTLGGFDSGVTAVAGGAYHSVAIKSGGVFTWGYNVDGELGIGTTTTRASPVAISTFGLNTGVTAIAGGDFHTLAVKNGGLYAWGKNDQGQLGNGTTTNSMIPVAIVASGLGEGVTAVAGGFQHSMAIKDGGVFTWGANGNGQLGNGTTVASTTPVLVTASGLNSGISAIAAGSQYSLALKSGSVYAWGRNISGELGNGTTSDSSTPIQVDPADLFNIKAIACGEESSYALSGDGSLWVWGNNGNGALGLGTSTLNFLTPQHLMPPTGYAFTSISAAAVGAHVVATVTAVPEPAAVSILILVAAYPYRRRKIGAAQN